MHARVLDIANHQPYTANTHRERCRARILRLNATQVLYDASNTFCWTRNEMSSAEAQKANLVIR